MNRVLLVEDDQGLSELLSQLLQLEGFEVCIRQDGPSGLLAAREGKHDILLLDVMLPGMNGFDLLKTLREHGSKLPVLMLTAQGDDMARVTGLELGADDYLPKPFNDRELLARIRAILRRSQDNAETPAQIEQINHIDITLLPRRQEVRVSGELVELTSTEYALLSSLITHSGEVASKEMLSQEVLGKRLMPFDRSLDMHLSNLRKKLPGRADGSARVKTVRGKGYIWLD
ncbi:response regulator [Ferrimonas lipolytica]|uniref:Response regulator n=1 Tax=Ferrimonas lipolytica TaxID=2724191 RepID=A0A6H1UHL4_9GAMM|nr:response regulator [Ferrimonas lipolytica]QIZ78119.1 response regulator [Ferrimonas lipolytica]